MEHLEKTDIQGLLLKGYGRMRNTRYALLHITDPTAARSWLSHIEPEVSDGNHPAVETCLNIAVTHAGLKAVGLNDANLRRFSREFREGMAEPHRQRLLGDSGQSSPDAWRWGGTRSDGTGMEDVHILLLVFGEGDDILRRYWARLEPALLEHGLRVVACLDGASVEGNREPFGFSDGISQPDIRGLHPGTKPANTVAPGEFLLGYENEYGVRPESPIIEAGPQQQGDVSLLPTIGPGREDLGRNGSYLVFRQMQQDVEKFWAFVRRNSSSEAEATRLASKMLGRWPSGAPLTLYPDADPGTGHEENRFGFADHDPDGLRCPIGAHIRRSNPRDVFEDNGASRSIGLTKKHRLLRRGRPYRMADPGKPASDEVGLHFICFNSDISHQFEFVQHTWCTNPRFSHLYDDPDPIVGAVEDLPPGLVEDFTVQSTPVNRRVHGLERFVTIRGGAYFFFPSFNAIRYLASL